MSAHPPQQHYLTGLRHCSRGKPNLYQFPLPLPVCLRCPEALSFVPRPTSLGLPPTPITIADRDTRSIAHIGCTILRDTRPPKDSYGVLDGLVVEAVAWFAWLLEHRVWPGAPPRWRVLENSPDCG